MKKIIALLVMVMVLFCMAQGAFAEDVQVTEVVKTHEQHKKQKIIKLTEDRLRGADVPEGWHVVQMQIDKVSLVNYYHVVIEEN